MPNVRRTYTAAEELALTTQVDGRCPLCGEALFYTKGKQSYRAFEIAHIYPLNPTPEEIEELKDVTRLHPDENHPNNLIPLCRLCHVKFDKPRTAEEYVQLAAKKEQFLRRAAQQELQVKYPLENDIRRVIDGLYTQTTTLKGADLEYDLKSLNDKFDSSLPVPTRQKITHAVTDYYQYIRGQFLEMERESPTASQLIYSQIRTFYLSQKGLGLSQPQVFGSVVQWIRVKTEPETIEAAEIIASFFVQNCEVFE